MSMPAQGPSPGRFLKTMQHDEITLGESALDVHSLARILTRHSEEIVNERLLAIPDGRIVLRIGISDKPLDCLGGFTLIEHQIVEGLRVLLIPFKLIDHP
jgi:hypothetical protein